MGEDAAHRRSIETQRDLHQRPRRGGKLQPVACRASHRPYTVHQPSDAQLHSLLTQHLRLLLLDPQFICGCSHRRHQTGVVDLFTHATQPRRETLTRVALCSCSSARTTNSACGPNTHTHTHTHTHTRRPSSQLTSAQTAHPAALQVRDHIPDVVTLPQRFRRAGYLAVSHGKVVH
jgi:hypothetical protein